MPATRIETRRGWIGERRLELIEAVQRGLQTGLQIPNHDRCIRLIEYDADASITPPAKGPFYLVIEIIFFAGRSLEAKRRLYSALVEELAAFDVPAQDIKIVLIESDPANWGIAGLPASEIDLGYKIKV